MCWFQKQGQSGSRMSMDLLPCPFRMFSKVRRSLTVNDDPIERVFVPCWSETSKAQEFGPATPNSEFGV